MKITINEKPRMTKEKFVSKWKPVSYDVPKLSLEMEADLNELLGEQQEDLIEFPCYMKSNTVDTVVFATSENYGKDECFCGHQLTTTIFKDNWLFSAFHKFHGTITIEQE